jgi:hypothetical protein
MAALKSHEGSSDSSPPRGGTSSCSSGPRGWRLDGRRDPQFSHGATKRVTAQLRVHSEALRNRGRHPDVAVVRRGLLVPGSAQWVSTFPDALRLVDVRTPGFSRPVLRFELGLREDSRLRSSTCATPSPRRPRRSGGRLTRRARRCPLLRADSAAVSRHPRRLLHVRLPGHPRIFGPGPGLRAVLRPLRPQAVFDGMAIYRTTSTSRTTHKDPGTGDHGLVVAHSGTVPPRNGQQAAA